MAFSHSPKIATDGLVFYYDTGNGKSYKGEPTTNLALNPTFNSTTNWYYATNGGGSFSTANNVGKITAGTAGSYTYLYQTVSTTVASNESLTWSVEFKNNIVGDFAIRIVLFLNGVVKTQPATYFSLDGTGGTVKKSVTTSHVDGANSLRIDVMQGSYYSGINTDTNIEFFNAQLERNSHATQFVNGTRSVTEGLLDLTKNETVNLSNAGFNSSAELVYDGTSDYLTVSQPNIQNSQGFSIELVFKPDSFSNSPMLITPQSAGIDHYVRLNGDGTVKLTMVEAPDTIPQNFTTTSTMSTTNYNHVVFTYQDSLGGAVYYNGTLEASAAAIFVAEEWINNWIVGQRGNNTFYFDGEMPIMKVYSKVLSLIEVQQNFNATKNRFGI